MVMDEGEGNGYRDEEEIEGEEWQLSRGQESQEGDTGEEVEVEEGEEDLMVPEAPVYQPCPEDDDFLAALDKMVTENISEAKSSSLAKGSLGNMSTPVSSGRAGKTWEQIQAEGETGGQESQDMKVVVMLRKGGKGASARGISVAQDSSLGEQLRA